MRFTRRPDPSRRCAPGFRLLPQCEGDFSTRVMTATRELLRTHAGAILVNSDSPTLPASILRVAVDATRRGGAVVLSPARDGGYTLIGVSDLRARLYADIPWSTAQVHAETVERAAEIGLTVTHVPGWYDVDDGASLALLEAELAGEPTAFAGGADAPATRAWLKRARYAAGGALLILTRRACDPSRRGAPSRSRPGSPPRCSAP